MFVLLILTFFSRDICASLLSLDLNGSWEALPGRYADSLFLPGRAAGQSWTAAPVPGSWSGLGAGDTTPCVWYRRRFVVPRAARGLESAVRLFGARWEVTVWLNGKFLGSDLSGYGVLEYNAAPALRDDSVNTLLVRTGGWNTLPKTGEGVPLFPVSSGPHWGPKAGALERGAEISFFRRGRMARVKADPMPERSEVRLRFTLQNVSMFQGNLRLETAVFERRSGKKVAAAARNLPFRESLYLKTKDLSLLSGQYDLTLRLPGFRRWTLEDPFLYEASAVLMLDGTPADSLRVPFGMRTFRQTGNRLELNGRPIFLRGGNLYGQDYWIGTPETRSNPEFVREYLIDTLRMLNFNCIRTHTHPMTPLWNDVADRHGLLVITEFTSIVNGSGWDLDRFEREFYRENLLKEYDRIMPEAWNHPSTIMWSITNESGWSGQADWDAWENGPLSDWFLAMDSTRPLLRASHESRHMFDNHVFVGWWQGAEGQFFDWMTDLAAYRKRGVKPAGVSEFMQFSPYTAAKWLGPRVIPDPDGGSGWSGDPRALNFHAQLALEYVEAMRGAKVDLILPYLMPPAGRLGAGPQQPPPPVFFALKNAYAPLGVRIDLFNRHYVAGTRLAVPVKAQNDSDEKTSFHLSLYLSGENPGFDARAMDRSGMQKIGQRILLTVGTGGSVSRDFQLELPREPGLYYLAGFLEKPGRAPAVSRREILIYPAPRLTVEDPLGLIYLPGRPGLETWMRKHRIPVAPGNPPVVDTLPRCVIAGPGFFSENPDSTLIETLRKRIEGGGRLLVLEQTRWLHPEWLKIQIKPMEKGGSGAAFFWGEKPPPAVREGLGDRDFYRFNGTPGEVITHGLFPDDTASVWMRAQDGWKALWEAGALAELKSGKGRVLFCQLSIARRVDPADRKSYDPVAEIFLHRLINHLLTD